MRPIFLAVVVVLASAGPACGQGRDGHDRIPLAESIDGATWEWKEGVWQDGDANRVNDPSVVKVGVIHCRYYARAAPEVRDDIALATSDAGGVWSKRAKELLEEVVWPT